MYDFFTKHFDSYIIENSKKFLIYLIPGEKLSNKFEWYGEQRAQAFTKFYPNKIKNDIEDRDFFFSHMLIWNKEEKQLAGGQRFLFSNKGCVRNKQNSYLEYYHPGTFKKMINE